MKKNKHWLMIISGCAIIAIISTLIYIYKQNEKNSITSSNQYSKSHKEISALLENGAIPVNMINHTEEVQNMKFDETTLITKKELFNLIDKGLKEFSNVKCFIYTKEIFEGEKISPVFLNEEYKDILDYLKIYRFKEETYSIFTLANTEEYIWIRLYNNTDQNNDTYIVLDKLTGKLKSLTNNDFQATLY